MKVIKFDKLAYNIGGGTGYQYWMAKSAPERAIKRAIKRAIVQKRAIIIARSAEQRITKVSSAC